MKKNEKKIIVFISFAIVILAVVSSAYLINLKNEEPEDISYNEFISSVENKEVKEVFIDFKTEKFKFEKDNEEIFVTDNPKGTDFKKYLLENDIKVSVIGKSTTNVLMEVISLIVRFGFLIFLFRMITKTMDVSIFQKKDAKLTVVPDVRFKNIAGNKETKEDMQFLVDFMKNPKAYHDIGAKLPKGVILYGPPGTGKTLTAKAIAGEAGVPFFTVNGSDFIEMYAGLGAKRVRDLFSEAKKQAPCIIFIDEIDAIGTKRGEQSGNGEKDQTINALLAELDGFNTKEPIITIVATNRVEDLDQALVRAGRFDRHIAIGLPDSQDRLELLNVYAKTKKIEQDVDLNELAKLTIGFSGADIEALMNEAAILAVNQGFKAVREEDIDDAYFKIIMKGHKKKNRKEDNEEELKLVAYHEAGHALCAKLLTTNSVPKVTIIPSTTGAGGVTFNIPKKSGLLTKKEILNNIKVLYAGRAAEYILRQDEDEITTGASQDIKQATNYINGYFAEFGMSEEFGMIQIRDEKIILKESIKLSKQLYKETLEFLEENKDKLEMIAEGLLEKETLNEEDLDRIIKNEIIIEKIA